MLYDTYFGQDMYYTSWMPPACTTSAAQPPQPRLQLMRDLSARERAVLHHMLHGLNNKLIARALNISPETVRFHLKAIYRKFGVRQGYANRRMILGATSPRSGSSTSIPC